MHPVKRVEARSNPRQTCPLHSLNVPRRNEALFDRDLGGEHSRGERLAGASGLLQQLFADGETSESTAHTHSVFIITESGLVPMSSVGQHKVRTERKKRKGMFTSLGKMSKWKPHEGNFAGDDTRVEEDDQTHEEETLRGRSHGLAPGRSLPHRGGAAVVR